MENTIKLGFIQAIPTPIKTPFWFTSDGSVHLSGEHDTITLDLEKQSRHTMFEICIGVRNGLITSIVPLADLEKILEGKQVAEGEKLVILNSTSKTVAEVKTNIRTDEAKKLLALPNTELKKAIGSNKIENNLIEPGINDVALLNTMAELEKETSNRNAVLGSIAKRIAAIEQVGILISAEELEIKEEEYKKVRYNENTQTLDEVTETTEA